MIKSRIYKVPFYVTESFSNVNIICDEYGTSECTKGGMIVVKKNILGNVKELQTGFNKFFYGYNPIQLNNGKYSINYLNSCFFNKIFYKYNFGFFLDINSFTDNNLASLNDLELWEDHFNDTLFSEFWLYYREMMPIISKKSDYEKQKMVIEKVKKLSKKNRI